MDELLPGSIVYGKTFEKYEEVQNGKSVQAKFSDGTTVEGRILVGGDGIFSQVRKQLMKGKGKEDELRFLGVFVMLGIFDVGGGGVSGEVSGGQNLFDGETVFQSSDGCTRIYSMPFDSERYMWQLSFPIASQDDGR